MEEENGGGWLGFRVGGFRLRGFLDKHGAEVGDGLDKFIGEGLRGFDLLPLLVDSGGALEVEFGRGGFAFGGERREHGLAVRREEGLHGCGFGGVRGCALGSAGLVAGREALFHLLVDAAGVLGIRGEVLDAAAEFEEVEDRVAVAVGGGARGERAVGGRERALVEPVGGVDARVGVVGGEAQEEWRA